MSIQRCKKCGSKFNYIDILDSVGWGYKSLNCRSCGAKHNLKMMYIFILAVLLSLPMFFIAQISKFALIISLNMGWVVLFYIIYIAIMVGLYPFIIRYRFKGDKNLNC